MLTAPSLATLTWTWQGYRCRYTVMGSGQPLLLIHGFGASVGHWRQNIPVLAKAGYQVFALDLLGFGASEKPPLDYCLELWQQQLHDFWAENIARPTVLVGNSIGGLLSLMLLAAAPELARAGVLINCAGGLNHRPEELPPPLRLVMGAFETLVRSPLTGPLLFNLIRQKPLIRNSLSQVYRDRTAITPELVEMLYRPACDRGAQQAFASILTAPPGPRPAELLPQITQPLLVLWGEDDPWTPIDGATIYRQLADQEARVQFHAIPRAGHCPHDEKPALVNALLLDWLQLLSSQPNILETASSPARL
ncbi:MAG: alpha/beta fold hydrolase [Spirulinaceae cyanobacterium SM2_1_0]|nr:alpha/beta fold hydrolase [Spirulinaceae cyanobacterium SM2_1_0]